MPPEQSRPLFSGDQGIKGGSLEVGQSGLSEPVVQFLRAMDAKLDAILGHMNVRSLREDFPATVLIHDISGAGLRFSCAESIPVGTVVEIVVALSSYPLRLAGTHGVVIRQDTENNVTLWALEFRDIRETERDKIIQFVISEQREQLRDRRSQI